MFSSLRLASMRSHKKNGRPGSVATSTSSDSIRTEDMPLQQQQQQQQQQLYGSHKYLVLDETDFGGFGGPPVSTKVAQIRVEREDGCLGVTLRGDEGKELLVTGVKPDGPIAKEGRVRPGDRLLAVDDTELRGLSLTEAQRALRRTSETPVASLTIEYDVANMEEARAATSGPLHVELERGANGELGLTVRETPNGVYIESLRPASTADRCGALQPGDRLITVDDVAIQDAIVAAKLLRNPSENCRIARLQIQPRAPSSSRIKRRTPRGDPGVNQNLYTKESLTVVLRPDHRGLGLTLRLSDDDMHYVVDILEAGGPAERSGVVMPGDKIIALNRRIVEDMQPAEVATILEAPQVEFVTEYKVGGPVVPTSGVFTVRVARPLGGQPDLGLTVNEDLIVDEVRRGSLAYRTGSLAPGDHLLAIDGQKLEPGDLRLAVQLLHRPGSCVVSLTIRKPDTTNDIISREGSSMSSDTSTSTSTHLYTSGMFRSTRGSLPSVDSAVDSWGEIGEVCGTMSEVLKHWDTASIDSGQLDLPSTSYAGLHERPSSEPRPLQILQVTLHKDPVYEDFGFSVSDGLYERGVYINRLRPNGPCDGILRPYDRIIRVNDASTEDFDCCLAVPLIAAAGARLDLTIARSFSHHCQIVSARALI